MRPGFEIPFNLLKGEYAKKVEREEKRQQQLKMLDRIWSRPQYQCKRIVDPYMPGSQAAVHHPENRWSLTIIYHHH